MACFQINAMPTEFGTLVAELFKLFLIDIIDKLALPLNM